MNYPEDLGKGELMAQRRDGVFTRRSFLKGTAAATVGTAAGVAGVPGGVPGGVASAAADPLPPMAPHGAELRGLDLVTKRPTMEGRFGFMFKRRPPHAASEPLLSRLGQVMEEKPVIGTPLTDPLTGEPVVDGTEQAVANKNHNDALGENPNPLLTSGFTFVGQFVDHDITFDTTPLDQQESDPYATTNFRTPRYDLDSVYGRGPTADPQLYDPQDRDKFLISSTPYSMIRTDTLMTSDVVYDVPRTATGAAIIADPRNEQTLILLQLHVAMQMFHNKLVDHMRALRTPRAAVFESARRMARWHYQWMVTHEFLPAVVGKARADMVYKEVPSGAPIIRIKYYKPTNPRRPFIPVEFSVAAYRFGHSITRPRYTVRDYLTSDGATVAVSSVPLFEAEPNDDNLNGSRPLPPRLKVQWSKFFNKAGDPRTARPVRQFDARLASPLFRLPTTALPDSNPLDLLSSRNLLRGRKMGLPSGQEVARRMGVTPLTNAQLCHDHRIEVKVPIPASGTGANVVEVLREFDVENQDLKELFADPGWKGEAPLWFYILKEAELVGRGRVLGPVGGRIVAEVLVGLLGKDKTSYLSVKRSWKPTPPIAPARGRFTMADLLTFAQVWS